MKGKYTVISGDKKSHHLGVFTAGEILVSKSGRWVEHDNSANTYIVATASSQQVDGYCDYIDSGTTAGDAYPIMDALDLVVEMPYYNGTSVATSTLTVALLAAAMNENCDIYIDGDEVQYADLGASSYDVITVVGGDVDENSIYTKRNPYPSNTTQGVA